MDLTCPNPKGAPITPTLFSAARLAPVAWMLLRIADFELAAKKNRPIWTNPIIVPTNEVES